MLKQCLFLSVICCLISACASFDNMSDNAKPENIFFDVIQHNNGALHYAYSGQKNKIGLLFVHGTPGSWDAFKGYLSDPELQQQYFMVSVDRLGWGKSESKDKKAIKEFQQHSDSISTIVQKFPQKRWIVIGHSYGASLAPKIALDNPYQIRGLLLLAGSHSPQLGKPRWYNRAANLGVINWLTPKMLSRSNIEIMALKQELTGLEQTLRKTPLQARIHVMQGMKDRLVSPKNTEYVRSNWQQHAELEIIELPEAGHFLPWNQTERVIEQIQHLAKLAN